MAAVLIALGSNVGDRVAHLQRAAAQVASLITIQGASHIYETEPMYVEDQPPFLNAAVKGETPLSPRNLLAKLKEVEVVVGRMARSRFGPREVDLDLVAYGSLRYRFSELDRVILDIPHPRTAERRFVLKPLDDIASAWLLPNVGVVHQLLSQTEGQAGSVTRSEHALFPI